MSSYSDFSSFMEQPLDFGVPTASALPTDPERNSASFATSDPALSMLLNPAQSTPTIPSRKPDRPDVAPARLMSGNSLPPSPTETISCPAGAIDKSRPLMTQYFPSMLPTDPNPWPAKADAGQCNMFMSWQQFLSTPLLPKATPQFDLDLSPLKAVCTEPVLSQAEAPEQVSPFSMPRAKPFLPLVESPGQASSTVVPSPREPEQSPLMDLDWSTMSPTGTCPTLSPDLSAQQRCASAPVEPHVPIAKNHAKSRSRDNGQRTKPKSRRIRPRGHFPCPKCGRMFGRNYNLIAHGLTHDPEQPRPFSCPVDDCDKAFARKYDAQRHYRKVHVFHQGLPSDWVDLIVDTRTKNDEL